MARPTKRRSLSVWMNGERVGTWTLQANGTETFSYVDEWLATSEARPISLSLPLAPPGTTYKGEIVTAYFDNLLPDSRQIRERIQRRFGTDSTRPFDLLTEIGRDCVGAIQLLPEDSRPPDVQRISGRPLTREEVGETLTSMLSPAPPRGEAPEFRISIAGAQEKLGLLQLYDGWMQPLDTTPSTHILKLPIGTAMYGIDLSLSVENEWLCAPSLRTYGVEVATCSIDQFGAQKALVVERFDRRPSANGQWILRLPQEDMCQATGTPGGRRYESEGGPGIPQIMELLLGSVRADEDRRDFLRTQILFWMLCAIDGHAKNFSLFIEPAGRYRLTPRYDVLSAFPMLGNERGKLMPKEAKMAMAVEGERRHYLWHVMQRRHWEATAHRCGLAGALPQLIDELVDRTPSTVEAVGAALPAGFPDAIATPILSGLRKSAERLASGAPQSTD